MLPGMRLSSKQPNIPPTKMVVLNNTAKVLSSSLMPVFMTPGCFCIHWHKTNGKKSEIPIMYRFRDDLKSTYCKADKPNAVIIPNITQNRPPTTGSGIIMKTAPNLLITPCNIIINAAHWITRRLPIYNSRHIVNKLFLLKYKDRKMF